MYICQPDRSLAQISVLVLLFIYIIYKMLSRHWLARLLRPQQFMMNITQTKESHRLFGFVEIILSIARKNVLSHDGVKKPSNKLKMESVILRPKTYSRTMGVRQLFSH